MDNFLDRLAQKLSSQEVIKANAQAEAAELKRLRTQLGAYEEWLAEAVAKGRIKAPGFFADPLRHRAYCRAQWNGPARGLLNPVQEVNAAVTRVQNGFSSRSAETMEMAGGDYYSNCEQLKQEEKTLKEVKDIATGSTERPKQEE